MNTEKYNPGAIRRAFKFLIDEFGYRVTRDEEHFNDDRPYAYTIEYEGKDRWVILSHDYRDNFLFVFGQGS